MAQHEGTVLRLTYPSGVPDRGVRSQQTGSPDTAQMTRVTGRRMVGPSLIIRVAPFGAVAAIVFVLFAMLLGGTSAGTQTAVRASTTAVQSTTEAMPVVAPASNGDLHSKGSGDGCVLSCSPQCAGLDLDCAAATPPAPLEAAGQSPTSSASWTGLNATGSAVVHPQRRPAPSLILLSIIRV
jgi:hypothetical protein